MAEFLAILAGTLAGWAVGPNPWHIIPVTAFTTVLTYIAIVAWRGHGGPHGD